LHSAGPQHGDEGSARLLNFLKTRLSSSFQIIAPPMPKPDEPNYESWKQALREIMKIMDDDMILIGHSLGGSVLLKFLSEEPVYNSINVLYLIAVPFWGLGDWEVHEFTLKHEFVKQLPVVRSIVIYQSKDDQIVSVDHAEKYASMLPGAECHILNGHGHVFWDGLPELVSHLNQLTGVGN